MNVYESGAQKAIPAVLIYARFNDQVLMLHRNQQGKADYHEGKWNGLGGKSELSESPLQTAQREFEEEAGVRLPLEAFQAHGVLFFPNFKAHKKEDWIVSVFSAEVDENTASKLPGVCKEGERHWISKDEILDLPLWEGDRQFLPLVLEKKPFLGTIWYEGEKVKHAWIHPL